MSASRDRLARILLVSYPGAWRRRYGDELLDLVGDLPLTPRVALDLVSTGLALRVSAARRALQGDAVMTIRPAWLHPTAFAVAAALILLPTFLFVVASLLSYELGLTAVRDVAAPIQAAVTSVGALDLFLVVAPVLALVAAVAPLLQLGWERREGTLQAVVTVRALALNMVIGLVAIGLGSVLVWHILVEALVRPGV
jgi:hypothetical protein